MNLTETAQLLALAKQFDNRNYDKVTVAAWQELLDDIDYRDAVEAVKRHFMESTEYLKLAHIRTGAQTIANRRLGRQRAAELEQQRRLELEGPPRHGTPPRERSEELAQMLRDLADKLGPGRPDQLRYIDPELKPRAQVRTADAPNPAFTGWNLPPVPGEDTQ